MKQFINKAVVNIANGKLKDTKKFLLDFISYFGQKPLFVKMKKKGMTFKIKPGMIIGGMCTLRKNNAENFIQILRWLVIPNIRGFKGFKSTCINKNTINLGIKDINNAIHISSTPIDSFTGFNISIVTTAKDEEETKDIFVNKLGLPLV